MKKLFILLSIFSLSAGTSFAQIDPDATKETKALFQKLQNLTGKGSLFGHQDDLAYGYTWSEGFNRSDVKDVTGSYPGLFGWDFGHLEIAGATHNIDGVPGDSIRKWIQFGNEIGSVITLSWHIKNPIYEKATAPDQNTVEQLLPGAPKHHLLAERLDRLAAFILSLKDKNGNPIPIIFRPWHEHNGEWFWWGQKNCTPDQYVQMWQFTVRYLRDEKNIHQLLYAISPDRSRTQIETFESDYFYAYPGDEYVDILGLDNYWDVGHPYNTISMEKCAENLVTSLSVLSDIGVRKNKLTALTETGNETVKIKNWYTGILLKGLAANEKTKRMVYSMVWRNRTKALLQPDHYYTPYKGHPEEADFIKFKNDPFILFSDELYDFNKLK